MLSRGCGWFLAYICPFRMLIVWDICCRFITTPSIGAASALGLWQWAEMKALWMMVYIDLFRGSGYDPWKLSVEIQTWVKALKALQWIKTDIKQWQ